MKLGNELPSSSQGKEFHKARGLQGNYLRTTEKDFEIGEEIKLYIPKKCSDPDVKSMYKWKRKKVKEINKEVDEYNNEVLVVEID
jgi:hypothetical protein